MKKFLALMLASTLIITGCKSIGLPQAKNTKINIVTTVGMIADITKNIAGEYAEVRALMGPGVDPHLYKASSGDTKKLAKADIVFYGGLDLEAQMVDIFEDLKKRKTVVAVSEGIPEELRISKNQTAAGGSQALYDPHVWFDVTLWARAVKEVEKTLSAYNPEHAAIYEKNSNEYRAQLDKLHNWALAEFKKIPREQRLVVTSHDAFSYFGRAYDFDVMGIQGISTASDYGLKDLENVINAVVERKVKAIFIESSVPKKSIEAVVQGARAKGHEVVIGGELFGDAMGDEGTFEGTYIGMVTHNVETIVKTL